MKYFTLNVLLLMALVVKGQSDCPYYDDYIKKGNAMLEIDSFRLAINAFSIALLHCPDNAKEAREGIIKAFKEIEVLKDTAIVRQKRAVASEKKAVDAKFLSDAYKYIYSAQLAELNDATTGLQLASIALMYFDSAKAIVTGNDSVIYDMANRIYYENNFGETIIDNATHTKTFGKNTSASYDKENNILWTLTDGGYGLKWDLSGTILDSIPLNPKTNSLYRFRLIHSSGGNILIHGFNSALRPTSGIIWNTSRPNEPYMVPNDGQISLLDRIDSIAFNAAIITREGWPNNIFVTRYQAYQLNTQGKIDPLIKGVGKPVQQLALSNDGAYIAINDGTKLSKLIKREGYFIFPPFDSKNQVVNIDFSPDNKILLIRTAGTAYPCILNDIEVSKRIEPKDKDGLYLPGYVLENHQFSMDSKNLLLSFSNKIFQVTQIYKRDNAGFFKMIHQFKCPGSKSSSAWFLNDSTLITFSDKIRTWKIQQNETVPAPNISQLNKDSVLFVSVDYNPLKDTLYGNGVSGEIVKYNLNGTKIGGNNQDTSNPDAHLNARLVTFINKTKKVVVVSENGNLKMFHKKQDLEKFLKTFKFEPFTEAQKRKYGIK